MEWSHLQLNKASVVKKEVDLALEQLQQLLSQSGFTAEANLTKLLNSLQSRIRELELFYSQNDHDERAVLFEKQRLRLRKAVQISSGSINNTTTPISSTSTTTPNRRPAPSRPTNQSQPHVEEPAISSTQPLTSSMLQSATTAQGTFSSAMGRVDPPIFPTTPSASTRGLPTSSPPPAPAPVYSWEPQTNTLAQGPSMREKVLVDGVSFVPSLSPGYYVREEDVPPPLSSSLSQSSGPVPLPPSSSPKFLDFQIVFTEEEMSTLISRKKAFLRSDRASLPSSLAGAVQSSTPYIEKKRVLKDHYRPITQERWVQGGATGRGTIKFNGKM